MYGLIGLGALVAVKYFYPSLKKFILKHCGEKKEDAADNLFQRQLALNQELMRMLGQMGQVPIPPGNQPSNNEAITDGNLLENVGTTEA